jgi:hypothetical protein
MRGAPARPEEIVGADRRERFVEKPGERWSAQEHAGHLLDLEPLWMARVDDDLAAVAELTTADLSNRKTHEAGHNQRRIEDILMEFRKARLRLVDRLGALKPTCSPDRSRIRDLERPCDWSTICASWPNPTIIIWRGFGSSS